MTSTKYTPNIEDYFDPKIQAKEIERLFKDVRYTGHQLMVPNDNDYYVVPNSNDRWALFNRGGELALQSNVCLHRQSKILEGRGNKKLISCRVHCWTYDREGQLKSSPHFREKLVGELSKVKVSKWNGLLFEGRTPNFDLKSCGVEDHIKFDDYFYHSTETTEYGYNWKTFVEVYLENYHVFSMHPGLRNFVTPSDLEWHFGEDYSVQKVGLGSNLSLSGSENYRQWQEAVQKVHGNELPRYGAIWIYIYPNIMIEWYPHTMAISTIYPVEPQKCVNHVEYYYNKDIYENFPQYYEAIQKVYSETAAEDEEACLLLDRGRSSLYLRGENEKGPCDPFLEAGVQKFYEYLHSRMASENF
jgi:choline monooxygenase